MFCKAMVILLLIHQINGYKANSILNISSIEVNKELRIATYKLYFLTDVIFQLISSADFIFKDINGKNDARLKNCYFKNVTIKIDDNFWKLPTSFAMSRGFFCSNLLYVHDIDINKVLNDVYKCQNLVYNYKARFYYIASDAETTFQAPNGLYVTYQDQIRIFWLITRKDILLLNNEINFQEFIKTCKSTSYNVLLLAFTGLLLVIIILIQIIFCITKKLNVFGRALNPIIMVQPIKVINTVKN